MPHIDQQTGQETKVEETLAPLYWVVMHNDPVTTMDFVVDVLTEMFNVEWDRAVDLMYRIHSNGLEYVALMPLERAEFKVAQVHRAARAQSFPLTCTLEPEDQTA